jgi:uncharacterized protein YukE
MGNTDRLSYDTGASAETQGNVARIAGQLESLIHQRLADVNAALSDFHDAAVDPAYHAKEVRWRNAANETLNIIRLLRTTLHENDATAQQAQSRARSAVEAI